MARPSRCRSSTRWCRRATLWSKTAAAASLDRTRLVCIEMVHGAAGSSDWGASQHLWSPAATGTRVRPHAERAQPARALPQVPDHRQRHRRARRRSGHAAGDRRRPFPVERRVPHADASEADRELGRARGHLARSDLREAVRTGHADSVDAAVHRERRSGGRLRLRLLVRLHRHDQLGVADRAAADDPRSADGVRSAVRRRRLDEGARVAPPGDQQRARLRHRRRSPTSIGGWTPSDRAADGALSRRRARDRAAHSEGRSAQHERRGARAARRAGRRARLVRRARQADVRPAGARVPGRRHARVLVQDGPRRVEPRLSGERRHEGLPPGVASRQQAGQHHRVRRRSTGITSACCRTSWRSSRRFRTATRRCSTRP